MARTRADVAALPGLRRAALAAVSESPAVARAHPAPSATSVPDVWWGSVVHCERWALPLAADVLDAEERDRAARLVHELDRTTYTVSHVVLRLLLAHERPDLDPAGLVLDRAPCPSCSGPHGRPVLVGGPEFSLSHTRGAFAVAIAASEVGVDIERAHDPAVAQEVAGSLHPRERDEITARPPEERPGAFARTWTRKESYLKALGTGVSRDLAADDVGAGPSPRSPGAGWMLADLALPPPFTGATTWRAAPLEAR
nr:4'-phosphopantetheinyl transferase superfamily protein [Cellulosimicrobium arenosum]